MRRPETSSQHGVDLRPELRRQLIQPHLSKEFIHAVEVVEATRLVNESRHLLAAGERSPAILCAVPNGRQVDAERNRRVFCKPLHRLWRPGAWNHEGCRRYDAFAER